MSMATRGKRATIQALLLSSRLREASDMEHSDARETRDDPSLSVRSQRGGIDFVRALTDPSAQLQ